MGFCRIDIVLMVSLKQNFIIQSYLLTNGNKSIRNDNAGNK